MIAWWEGISHLEQIFVIIAASSTVILVIQTMLLIFGGGLGAPDSGLDSDVSGMGDSLETDAGGSGADAGVQQGDAHGLRLFSVSSILTFLTVFGWSGVILLGAGLHPVIAASVSGLLGFAALYAMARMIKGLMTLQESGNINYRRALGKTARVYLTVPPAGQGQGKINLVLGDSLGEFWAVTDGTEAIPTGAAVRIVDLAGGVYTVEREG